MNSPASLEQDLDSNPPALRAKLDASGFDRARLFMLAKTLTGDVTTRRDTRNRVSGAVQGPSTDEIADAPTGALAAELAIEGEKAMARGELAFIVMAGGMA